MSFKFLESSTIPDFHAIAYAEYLESCCASYSELLNVIDEVTSIEDVNFTIPGTSAPTQTLSEVIDIETSVLDQTRSMILTYAKEQAALDDIILDELPLNSATAETYIHNAMSHYSYAIRQWLTDDGYTYLYNDYSRNGWSNRDYEKFLPYLKDLDTIYNSIVIPSVRNIFGDVSFNLSKFVPFNEGYISLSTIIKEAFYTANSAIKTLDDELTTTIYDNIGNVVSTARVTLKNLITQIKTNMEGAMAIASGIRAMTVKSVTERLALFQENMRLYFDKGVSTFTNMTNLVRNKLVSAKSSMYEFTQWVNDIMDLDVIATQDGTTYGDTKAVHMTGCSPNIVIDFDLIRKGAITTGKVIAGVAKTILSSVVNLGVSLFNKIKDKVVETLYNPVDIVSLDTDSQSGLIDVFGFEFYDTFYLTDDAQGDHVTTLHDNSDKFIDKWIKFSFYFGEILVRPERMSQSDEILAVECEFKYKPRPIAKNVLDVLSQLPLNINKVRSDVSGTTLYTFDFTSLLSGQGYDELEAVNTYINNFDNPYCDGNATEQELYNGYLISQILMTFNVAAQSMYDMGRDYVYDSELYGNEGERLIGRVGVCYFDDENLHPITNLSALKLVSGWNAASQTFKTDAYDQFHEYSAGAPANNPDTVRNALKGIMGFYCSVFVDKILNPHNFEFLPYSNNHTDFDAPQFRIKTDEENQAAATKFLTIVVGVVIAVAAIAITTTAIKLRKISRYAKLNRRAGVLDNKMWNGGKLNAIEKLSYFRANKKLDKMNEVGSGMSLLTTAVSASNSIDTIVNNVNDITSLANSNWKYDNDKTLMGKVDNIDVDSTILYEIRTLIDSY